MKLSFLYPDGITTKAALNINEPNLGRIGPRTLYHLSLDKTFAAICDDELPRSVFLKVLSMPSTDPAVITYRQQLLQELAAKPAFFPELQDLYGRFKGLRDSHDRERQAMMRQIHNSTAGASAQTLKNLLQANALTLKRCLAFVRSISDLLGDFRIGEDSRSVALKRLFRETSEISKSASYDRLSALCKRFEDMGIDSVYDFAASLGESGQIEICRMIEHKHLHISDPDFQPRRRWFGRRTEETADTGSCVRIHMIEDTTYDKLMSVPLQLLSEQLDTLSDQLFDRFCHIADELSFYDVALRYLRSMDARDIRLTYPAVSHEQNHDISGLRDVALIMEENRTEPVIPNNVGGNALRGMIVFGENNSGKTVFLRSLGCAQLLAQAGLPIPADGAKMPVCTQIMTQFSEAEKEFERGNDAGRFEQEVRELASVIDDLDSGALILLNETFQTTAYDEGAEGLYHILGYFSAQKIRFLLVSHLHQLEGRFNSDEVGVYRTRPGFKVSAEG